MNEDHFECYIETLENAKVRARKVTTPNEFARVQKQMNEAMEKFVNDHTLYFNQRYYVDLEGDDQTLANALGVELPRKGETDGEDSN